MPEAAAMLGYCAQMVLSNGRSSCASVVNAQRAHGSFARTKAASHVDRRLDVMMAAQDRIHGTVQNTEIGGIETDPLRSDLLQPGAHTLGVGGQVGGASGQHSA